MFQGILGVIAFIGFGYLISEHRKEIAWRAIVAGLTIQVVLAALLLKVSIFKNIFMGLNEIVLMLDQATAAGTSFVFGYLGGGALPFTEPFPGSAFILAFKALPLVLVVSALSSLLFYWRVIPTVVGFFSKALTRLMGIGGALGLGAAANIFVGMVEAPLFIRPYLERMTRSRNLHHHDLRYGHHRRNCDGSLREHPNPRYAGCDGTHAHSLHHQRAGVYSCCALACS